MNFLDAFHLNSSFLMLSLMSNNFEGPSYSVASHKNMPQPTDTEWNFLVVSLLIVCHSLDKFDAKSRRDAKIC